MKIKKGDKVSYLFWGFEQTARMKGQAGMEKLFFWITENGCTQHR